MSQFITKNILIQGLQHGPKTITYSVIMYQSYTSSPVRSLSETQKISHFSKKCPKKIPLSHFVLVDSLSPWPQYSWKCIIQITRGYSTCLEWGRWVFSLMETYFTWLVYTVSTGVCRWPCWDLEITITIITNITNMFLVINHFLAYCCTVDSFCSRWIFLLDVCMGVINYRNLANSQALAANLANSPTIRSLDITLILIGPTDSGGWSYRTHVRPSFRPSVCSSVRSFFSKTGYRIFPKLGMKLKDNTIVRSNWRIPIFREKSRST